MSNDNPPRACLTDHGLMDSIFCPSPPVSCSAQLEVGTTMFMSPELLVPSKFGLERPNTTPEADIYAFGLVIYQVCDQDPGCLSSAHMAQVLTGELPFRGLRKEELVHNVVEGVRPPKPENASAIGFSDSLWRFTQRCWNGDPQSRPKDAEVVAELERAAADWVGAMPSSEDVAWKRLIRPALPVNERVDLIKFIFFDRDEAEMFDRVSGNDAQTFVDVIYEASIYILLPLEIGSVESH